MPFQSDVRVPGGAPVPYGARTPDEFLEAMREYRAWAGAPSYPEMEYRSGGVCTAERFRRTLEGAEPLTVALVGAFITACGGDAEACGQWTTALRSLRLRMAERAQGRGAEPGVSPAG
ncbi:hypothetical protein HDA36_004786 [Nocardiopsis composta]|uniref:Uncharacterized protein n=1 Tax=Nocardiopsis composta TaxID=157465 RepID=A0A7W8QQG3_9ACTN|nr:hypothetical protein [Nocardiopsis composta]